MRKTIVHKLKIQDMYAERIFTGEKTFEVRINDRDYQKGDILQFTIYSEKGEKTSIQPDPKKADCVEKFTKTISYVHSGYGMQQNYVILGIE